VVPSEGWISKYDVDRRIIARVEVEEAHGLDLDGITYERLK